jgi:hypothetical protein
MSLEELRDIHVRVDRLQMYIARTIGLKTKIDSVCAVFPGGIHYDNIVQDLKRLLPATIDASLRDVEAYCAKLGEPYRTHIVVEVSGILSAL